MRYFENEIQYQQASSIYFKSPLAYFENEFQYQYEQRPASSIDSKNSRRYFEKQFLMTGASLNDTSPGPLLLT
jgi:hypothetical protein